MLENHEKKTVWEWTGGVSLCPECKQPLLARKGDIVIWHWAHFPSQAGNHCGGGSESDWHLRWKLAYRRFPGWQIESSIVVNAERYRLDAFNPHRRQVVEFVHSLSDTYLPKDQALKAAGYQVYWILNGVKFVSVKSLWCQDRVGLKRLLKPRAYDFAATLEAHVHIESEEAEGESAPGLWKRWRGNCWYPTETQVSKRLLESYEQAGEELTSYKVDNCCQLFSKTMKSAANQGTP